MQKLYTVPEVAKILHVKKAYVYDLIYTGRICALRLSVRRFRISSEALNEFIKTEEAALRKS